MMSYFKSCFTKIHIIFFLLISLFAPSYASEAPSFVVVIDAGHGGHDPGALGKLSQEKNINLSIALAFGQMIEKNDPSVKVIYTRKTDRYLTLQERADVANNAHADLFVCVHSNANVNQEATGSETYTLGLTKSKSNLDVAMRENSVILLEDDYKVKYEGFNPRSVDSYIMFECIQDKYIDKSVQIASDIQKNFAAAGRKNRGVRQAGFWVLHKTAMPSILVEVGYITNPEEEHFLNSTAGQQKIAGAIFAAFEKFRKEYERKSGKQNYVSASAFDKQNRDSSSSYSGKPNSVSRKEQAAAVERTTKNKRKKITRTNNKVKKEPDDSLSANISAVKKEQPVTHKKLNKKAKTEKASQVATNVQTNQEVEPTTGVQSQTGVTHTEDVAVNTTTAKETTTQKKVRGKKTNRKEKLQSATGSLPEKATPAATDLSKSAETAAEGAEEAVIYKLQLFAVSKKLPEKTSAFKGLKTEYFEEGNFFKYTYGNASDYATILRLKKQIAAKFPNAMIISFKNGKKLPVQENSK